MNTKILAARNTKILAARGTNKLVRVWRTTGDLRRPLACVWEQADSPRAGGLRLCA